MSNVTVDPGATGLDTAAQIGQGIVNPVAGVISAGTGVFNAYTNYKAMKAQLPLLKEQTRQLQLDNLTEEERRERERKIRNMVMGYR